MIAQSKKQYVSQLNNPAIKLARSLRGVHTASFPNFIVPALATLAPHPPQANDWLHEIKYDGYRFQAHVYRGTRFYTRRGYEWSKRVPGLVRALSPLINHAIILDGEVVVQTPDGHSDFHALEKALKAPNEEANLLYYVFDILYLDGWDLRGAALFDRKRVLSLVLQRLEAPIRFSEHMECSGNAIWKRACELGLEGVVSKRRNGRYSSGRTNDGSSRCAAIATLLPWSDGQKEKESLMAFI